MLLLRPNCELCDGDLPLDSDKARICTYEWTYCARCAEEVVRNVCPTCGGNFVPRPVRPKRSWRPAKKLGLGHHPASETRVHSPYAADDIRAHVDRIMHIPPRDRSRAQVPVVLPRRVYHQAQAQSPGAGR